VAKEKEEKESASVLPEKEEKTSPKDAKTAAKKSKEKAAKPPRKPKNKQPFLARRLLIPLVPLYKLALSIHGLLRTFGMEPTQLLVLPVVSIGNLSTGGSGKTPLAITLAKALGKRGVRVDVLSRGYGREGAFAARVHPQGTAREYGDEPLLIARATGIPVYVAAQRFDAGLMAEVDEKAEAEAKAAAKAKAEAEARARAKAEAEAEAEAIARGEAPTPPVEPSPEQETLAEEDAPKEQPKAPPPPFSMHLLDDGFQHRQLARAVDILLLNQHDWQDWLLPAGNLREPIDAVHRASVVAIPQNEPLLEIALHMHGWQGPIWKLRRKMEIHDVSGPVAAFCGIARPEQFFKGLEEAGLQLTHRFCFPDHYTYPPDVLIEMLDEVRQANVTTFVTTEKDLVRLGKLTETFPQSIQLVAAHLRVEIEDEDTAIDWLIDRLQPRA
jgi:tetraacyldisaccharide 4'-kinase